MNAPAHQLVDFFLEPDSVQVQRRYIRNPQIKNRAISTGMETGLW